jgi:hypothetical protein
MYFTEYKTSRIRYKTRNPHDNKLLENNFHQNMTKTCVKVTHHIPRLVHVDTNVNFTHHTLFYDGKHN